MTCSVAPGSVASGGKGSLPLENYDELSAREVAEKLEGLSKYEVWIIRSHEQRHRNRRTLLEELDRRLV